MPDHLKPFIEKKPAQIRGKRGQKTRSNIQRKSECVLSTGDPTMGTIDSLCSDSVLEHTG